MEHYRIYNPSTGEQIPQRVRAPFTVAPHTPKRQPPDPVSLGDVTDHHEGPADQPPSTAPIGDLGIAEPAQGIEQIGDIGQQPSGAAIDPLLHLPDPANLPDHADAVGPTSGIAESPPWLGKPASNPFWQVWQVDD